MRKITKAERIMNKVGFIGLLVASFAWGFNSDIFKKDK